MLPTTQVRLTKCACVVQIGQVMLALPNAVALTGLRAGVPLLFVYSLFSIFTIHLLTALYCEYKARKVRVAMCATAEVCHIAALATPGHVHMQHFLVLPEHSTQAPELAVFAILSSGVIPLSAQQTQNNMLNAQWSLVELISTDTPCRCTTAEHTLYVMHRSRQAHGKGGTTRKPPSTSM